MSVKQIQLEIENLNKNWKLKETKDSESERIYNEELSALEEKLFRESIRAELFPKEEVFEKNTGLYPDLNNEKEFLQKLLPKQEFLDCKQESLKETKEKNIDKCRSTEDFEISPAQRFVSRLLSPHTPYNSALLFHGVGVGKTCTAITLAESYLKEYPGKKIYIVAPPNIQDGFKRTIFDMQGLQVATKTAEAKHRGCTGNRYLEITNSLRETKANVIEDRVTKAIKSRYEFFGYTSFYNYIYNLVKGKIPEGTSPEKASQRKMNIYRNEFSNRVIIIDEAHNLRDNPLEDDTDAADDANPSDTSESKAGKRLTPYLQEVLDVAEGTTLLLMTATPMYNSFVEIVFLLNLLLRNNNLKRLIPSEVFEVSGRSYTGEFNKNGGRELLGKVASQYISFVRGENPLTFPTRLMPDDPKTRVTEWPTVSPRNTKLLTDLDRAKCVKLPCVKGYFSEISENLYRKQTNKYVKSADGLGITTMDLLIQGGNWIFPGDSNDDFLDRIRQQGFDNTFSKEKRGSLVYFKNINESLGASWLLGDKLAEASGKCAVLLERLNNCKGVAFIYSRFVASGALTIALALEANGYTCWNRDIGFLAEGNQQRRGRQCALCNRHESGHGTVPQEEGGAYAHTFKPAKYVLLTGSEELSPSNSKSIDAARSPKNIYGEEVKVVIGSQIAGEGLDLKYIREIFVFDGWYHLNKLEQVIGRGIRNCSHAALPDEKKNCTVTLLVNAYKEVPDLESIDMYSYRQALKKAIVMGKVTRLLKEYAIDCTLNKGVNQVTDLKKIPVLYDSQGKKHENIDISDVPLTSMCDWLDKCDFQCKFGDGNVINMKQIQASLDTSTYDEYSARFQIKGLKTYLQNKIAGEKAEFVKFEDIKENKDFHVIPQPLLKTLLKEILDEKQIFKRGEDDGYIILENGYFLFQPERIKNTSIPIALRVTHLPTPRDRYEAFPIKKDIVEADEEDSEPLWDATVKWADAMKYGTADLNDIPSEFLEELKKLKSSAGSLFAAQKERFEVILHNLYKNIQPQSVEIRERFANTVLEYVWDEFLTLPTKKNLLVTQWQTNPLIQQVAADAKWDFEEVTYLRILNDFIENKDKKSRGEHPSTYYYSIENGNVVPTSGSVKDILEKSEKNDPLTKLPLDMRYTGSTYGFLVYNVKKRKFIFKTNKPPLPKKSVSRGKDCSSDSKSAVEQIELFKKIGDNLQKKGHPDIGLSNLVLRNSVRACTASDIILRYVDKMGPLSPYEDHRGLDGKRWFYRPLESKLYKHPL